MKNCQIVSIYEFLRDNDYIQPGFIDSDILSPLIGCDDVDNMAYVGPLINLVKHIEKQTGLFCKCIDKGIYIYSEDECALISKKRGEKAERITQHTYHTLLNTNLNNISNADKRREHEHQIHVFCMLSRNSKLFLHEFYEE